MKKYTSSNREELAIATFAIGLYYLYEQLGMRKERAKRMVRLLEDQCLLDKKSLFKRKLYLKMKKQKKSAKFRYYLMHQSTVWDKLKCNEKHTCWLLHEKHPAERKRVSLRSILKCCMISLRRDIAAGRQFGSYTWSSNILYAVIRKLIYLNFEYARFSDSEAKELYFVKSYFLLRQFPAVRKRLFKSGCMIGTRFSDFLDELEEFDYSFK